MTLKIEPSMRGDEIHEIRVMETLKIPIINLYKTYPIYYSYGIIETYFEKEFGNEIINKLNKDGFIEIASKKEEKLLNKKLTNEQLFLLKKEGKEKPNCWYRLTSKGVDLAISIINLDYGNKIERYGSQTLNYSKEMRYFTIAIITLGSVTLLLSFFQLLIQILK